MWLSQLGVRRTWRGGSSSHGGSRRASHCHGVGSGRGSGRCCRISASSGWQRIVAVVLVAHVVVVAAVAVVVVAQSQSELGSRSAGGDVGDVGGGW